MHLYMAQNKLNLLGNKIQKNETSSNCKARQIRSFRI
jgi:hypothetical protein